MSDPTQRHTIEIEDEREGERSHWSCDCGTGGTCASYNVDFNAERHVPEGALVSYRYVRANA